MKCDINNYSNGKRSVMEAFLDMNNKRRNELNEFRDELLNAIDVECMLDMIESLSFDISSIKDDEEEALENLPESLLDSERGVGMQENVEDIELISDYLEDIKNSLSDIKDVMDTIDAKITEIIER